MAIFGTFTQRDKAHADYQMEQEMGRLKKRGGGHWTDLLTTNPAVEDEKKRAYARMIRQMAWNLTEK